MSTIADVIIEAEKRLERGLTEDEVVLVGRMIELEKGEDEILELLGEKVVIPTDEELQTIRYDVPPSLSDPASVVPLAQPEQYRSRVLAHLRGGSMERAWASLRAFREAQRKLLAGESLAYLNLSAEELRDLTASVLGLPPRSCR